MYKTHQQFSENYIKYHVILGIMLIVQLPAALAGKDVDNCPAFCTCYTWYHLRWASCSGKHLYSIETGISNSVQALDISNNEISMLGDNEFQTIGLKQLKYLNLSDNVISQIGLSAFAGLSDLTILDLSRNHLYYILPNTFVDNKNLRVLRLAGNNFNQHVPFLENPSITELSLASCRLSHLPTGAFSGLKQLRNLDLSNNLMIQLEEEVLRVMPFLRILSIKDNPWACGTKEMTNLQRYLGAKRVLYESSVCLKSQNTKKKFEKMIVAPSPVVKKNYPARTVVLPINKGSGNSGWEKNDKSVNIPTAVRKDEAYDRLKSYYESAAMFFGIFGFIAGVGVGVISVYIWLASRRIVLFNGLRRDTIQSVECSNPLAQRASLLRNIWANSDEDVNSLRRVPVCPDTPPPPYRDVILHSNRYPVG